MAWEQLWITKPHLAYAVIGGFTTVFSLVSLFVKEKLYIGEATVATIFGIIVGPHCLNWFAPTTWGNTDNITLEISRVVLVVQIFAVAVELPKKYMLKHWLSVFLLLFPVMTFGWLISSVFIWKLVPTLSWIEGLVVAACITATDPVLASAVVGKGKFARRVPGHLRNLLSAESGCNDGMAFPFVYLALLCIQYKHEPNHVAFHFIVVTVLYECVFGTILGAIIGYSGRHLIKFAERKNLIDRESFLVFYFVLALFCTGVGSIIGVDDLLVAFAAGAAFSWDGWFAKRTEESHVSDVIDLLLNMAFFVYFGAIIPWEQYNNSSIGILPWKLVIIAILLILFRRLPIMLALKPVIPDIRTWREALFCGHFGPIGVGAIFISILARAELEHDEPTPLSDLPSPGSHNYMVIATIWPIVTFMILASIIVHGSSIAVFTLGKRLNNLTITLTNTNAGEQTWLSRIQRSNSARPSISSRKELEGTMLTDDEFRPVTSNKPVKPIGGMKRRKHKKNRSNKSSEPELRVPEMIQIDLNANRRERDNHLEPVTTPTAEGTHANANPNATEVDISPKSNIQAYQEGSKLVIEDSDGEVLDTLETDIPSSNPNTLHRLTSIDSKQSKSSKHSKHSIHDTEHHYRGPRSTLEPLSGGRKVVAYRLDDDVIIENLEGEVIKRYRIEPNTNEVSSVPRPLARSQSILTAGLNRTLSLVGLKKSGQNAPDLERQEIVPVKTATKPLADESIDDERMKRRLKSLFSTGVTDKQASSQDPSTSASGSVAAGSLNLPSNTGLTVPKSSTLQRPVSFSLRENDEEEETDSDDSRSYSEDEEENDDEHGETEIERQRRLAVLQNMDDDDDAEFLKERAAKLQNLHKS